MALSAVVVVVAGCTSPLHRAPVEERTGGSPVSAPPGPIAQPGEAIASLPVTTQPPQGSENAGKPGYYSVKSGDTLIHIGLDTGQNWRDIARWNNIDNPNVIEVGQVLRVVAPNSDPNVTAARAVATSRVEVRPLETGKAVSTPVAPAASGGSPSAVAMAPAASAATAGSPAQAPAAVAVRPLGGEDLTWTWPSAGPVADSFDETHSKGVSITGKAGDPVLAAADGRVVYAGSGLRGYGNLIIVKHNNTYLTAYAHNQTLLVKEDQAVHRGQKIAEMGATDASRVELHFEIRKLGKPIDPVKLLPPR